MDSRALIWLFVVACAGPEPEVEAKAVSSAQAGYQRVTAVIHNKRGHGQITIDIELHGPVDIHASRDVEVSGESTVEVVADIPAPDGTYRVDVDAKYPD